MTKHKLPNTLALAYLALFVTNLVWAAAGPVIKLTLEHIPLFAALLLRFTLACIVLLPFIILEVKKSPISKKDYFNFFMLGLFSQTGIAFIFAAFKYTTALEATIIGILGMLLSVFAGHYFYKEKVSNRMIVGLIVASIGTLMIVVEPIVVMGFESADARTRLIGNIFAVLYNLAFLFYVIWSKMSMGQRSTMLKKTLSFIHLKPMSKTYSPFAITGVSFYVGLATFIPLAFMESAGMFGKDQFFTFDMLTTVPIAGLIYLAIFSSLVAYLGYQWALRYVSVSDTAIFYYLEPVMTIPFAYLLLTEVPTTATLISSAVIAVGVVIAETHKS